ncbi:MAG TPA: O-methyltransferase [Actinopolymorphaceae bacterium]
MTVNAAADPRQLWDAVDRFFVSTLHTPDETLEAALARSAEAGLPPINVAPNQGKLLHLLARLQGARRILEVGTLGGYSTIWLARALPAGGTVVTLEVDPRHAEVAAENLVRAGVAESVDIRVGRGVDTMTELVESRAEPFDLIFIDADKPSNPDYFRLALQLSRPGTLVVVDNVVRGGAVADADSDNPDVVGVRRLAELAAAEPRVTGTAVQTVGSKGYDGFALFLVD